MSKKAIPTPSNEEVIQIPVGRYLSKLRNNPWSVTSVVLAVALLAVLLFNPFGGGAITGNTINADQAGQNALDFINSNPDLQGEVDIISVEQEGAFYLAVLGYQDQQVPIYLTLDGEYILTGRPISLSDIPNPGNDIQPPTAPPQRFADIDIDDDATLGNPNAPITIIEFSDYQCPFCQGFWSDTLPLIKENYIDTGKVKLVYRDFPLSIHSQAQIAAEAAECVRSLSDDETYFNYHDMLFENQLSLSEENMKTWAKNLDHDISDCLDSGEFTNEVLADLAEGTASGVTGTPAFFINGKPLSGAQPYAIFEQIIEAELA